jgi:hypothetical protein
MSSPTADVAIGIGLFLFFTLCMVACLLTELVDCLFATATQKTKLYTRVAVDDTDDSNNTAYQIV